MVSTRTTPEQGQNGSLLHLALNKLYLAISVIFVAFHLYTALFGVLGNNGQRPVHLLLMLVLLFLRGFIKAETLPKQALNLIFLVLGAVSCTYIWRIMPEYSLRGGITTTTDVVFGILLIATLLVATWQAIGPSLSIVAACFIAYAFVGRWLPSILQHGGFQLSRFIHLVVYTSDGIFGSALNASANYIVLFIILGAVFNETGVGNYFTGIATAAFGRMRGGPAKVAVVASGFFGSISGSSIANVIGTGTFTIPMMKKTGFEPEYAGAVEAAASTGGQIMPPVMGAAAFLVAEILQVPYFDVVKAAAIPAILYFLAVLMIVDLYARRKDLRGMEGEEVPSLRKLLPKLYLFSPLVALIVFIGPLRLSITKGGIYTLVFTLAVVSFSKENRLSFGKIGKIATSSANGSMSVAAACALVGVIIGTVLGSGLGYRLSAILVDASGGRVAVLLLLTMVVSLILGMGLPTSAAYLVLATLVAPAMIKLGVLPMAAHLFIFYFGVISNITPPVAMAAYAAAGIAGCSPSKCGFRAFQIALSGFILPFMFVYNPVLLAQGLWYQILYSFAMAVVGIYLLSCAVEGYYIRWPIGSPERALLLCSSLLLIDSRVITDAVGAVVFVSLLLLHLARDKKQAPLTDTVQPS